MGASLIDMVQDRIDEIFLMTHYDFPIRLEDHIGGFDCEYNNKLLHRINDFAKKNHIIGSVILDFPVGPEIKQKYSSLVFEYFHYEPIWKPISNYNIHPDIKFENFVCSFNRSAHVSRKLLTATLDKWNMFDERFSSKKLEFTVSELDGHIKDLVGDKDKFYRKFILDDDREKWYSTSIDIGNPTETMIQHGHDQNILLLEKILTSSFLHIVSESMATSGYPFVSEKFLYSVVTRGLFLAYGQKNWHKHLEYCYGFRLYENIFDYSFDNTSNPIERLIDLLCMVSKFSKLSKHEWHDLYQMESENIEHNYDHFFSGRYLDSIKKFMYNT